jgi:hypothetical protein
VCIACEFICHHLDAIWIELLVAQQHHRRYAMPYQRAIVHAAPFSKQLDLALYESAEIACINHCMKQDLPGGRRVFYLKVRTIVRLRGDDAVRESSLTVPSSSLLSSTLESSLSSFSSIE